MKGGISMKQRKKRPSPPPSPVVMEQPEKKEEQTPPPQMETPMFDWDDPVYLERHQRAQELQLQSAREGFVLLKNSGILPLTGTVKLNVFGRHGAQFFTEEICRKYGVSLNRELLDFYRNYQTRDPGYTGSGWDEETKTCVPQSRTATGMFGGMGYLEHEPFIGYDVRDLDGSVRVAAMPGDILQRARDFSDTAVVVLYRHGGEGADHEKGDERLSEGETAMLSFCTANFSRVIVVLACNSVIDGDFLVTNREHQFHMYTYGGGVYSNNIGREILADYESRVELKYPEPHVYPLNGDRIGGVFYTCNNPGDRGAEALMELLLGRENPSGRLMDEILYDYDDNPVSVTSGGLVFSRASTTEDLYIYGHNYVAYKEGVYLGYRYFETFCPEKVVYPFGFGLSYTDFFWSVGALETGENEYGELQFSCSVTVTNRGSRPGKDVVELYVTAPYYENGPYHLEKPLVCLAAFEKTALLAPGERDTVTLRWHARDVACYSDVIACYVLERGTYRFSVAGNANLAHRNPAAVLCWDCGEEIRFTRDEVTGTPYRNLFTGSDETSWRYDAKGTEKEHIVYLHRIDVDGKPVVAPGTYPETVMINAHTRETDQILDLERRGLESFYEMDSTREYLYPEDIPVPRTNGVYRDGDGKQKNFMLQDVYRYTVDEESGLYHDLKALKAQTGISAKVWNDDLVWDYFLDQLSVNEMLCRFYHCGFDIPALLEYGIPVTYSADTPGQIGANNKMPMGRTTRYCDTILACTFNKTLLYELGLALAREVAASGENGTTFFYAPGSNIHRSCLSGKNNNYWSEDAYLTGMACGHFLKGLQEGGVVGCLKHFACNDQEISREGLVVFSNEQALREIYFAAFEHALKIGKGRGIMTSLGRVGTVNACGNGNLTVELLRKEWGFDGMVITDGYGVTSYMYEISDMLGANSGLLCFNNSGNFGACGDFMELYRYYLQYPGRTTAALRSFMRGSLTALMDSHTFRELYKDYEYRPGPSTDINWYDGQIGIGFEYEQGERLTYLGIKLKPGETNPPSMMPNTNCKDRSGTIRVDDYGLRPATLEAQPGQTLRIPVAMEKCCGMQQMGFTIRYNGDVLRPIGVDMTGSVLSGYHHQVERQAEGVTVKLWTEGNLCDKPCGTLFHLVMQVRPGAQPGAYPLTLLPLTDEAGEPVDSFMDKQGNPMSISLVSQRDKYNMSGGWSGVYQAVESSGWQKALEATGDDLADITLLSGIVRIL